MGKTHYYRFIPVLLCFLAATAYASDNKASYYRGLDLYHQRDYQGSVQAFRDHLKQVPDDPAAKKWLKKAVDEAQRAGKPIDAELAKEILDLTPAPDPKKAS